MARGHRLDESVTADPLAVSSYRLGLWKGGHTSREGLKLVGRDSELRPDPQHDGYRNKNQQPVNRRLSQRLHVANLHLKISHRALLQRTAADDRLWLRLLFQQSINDQEDDGTDGGDENPAEVERLDLAKTDEATQKTADDRAGDADENRDNTSAWVLPGHEELCDSPCN